MYVRVQGGTNAGWRTTRAQVKSWWVCAKCNSKNKYFWTKCPKCGGRRE